MSPKLSRASYFMAMLCLLLGFLVSAVASGGGGTPPARSCEACHQKIVASFIRTAHFQTSAEATARTVRGRFSEGHNLLATRVEGVYFRMQRRKDAFYETGVDSRRGTSRTESIDLVIGSGRRGQSYLYWSGGLLFELPASYLTAIGQWINSPGYADGQIDFERLIIPRCLECHATSFGLLEDRGRVRYSRAYVLGIACEKCHGDGRAHATAGKSILNPGRFMRDRRVDNCALCHSGDRDARQPAFSYRPGENLDDYFVPASDQEAAPDVHGNQVGLLRRSKCFRSSPDMSCSTCHDVHRPERDLRTLAGKCLTCHEITRHKMAATIGSRMMSLCVDCHMPNQPSHAIEINTATTQASLYFRSHAIGIYPGIAARVLQSHTPQSR